MYGYSSEPEELLSRPFRLFAASVRAASYGLAFFLSAAALFQARKFSAGTV